MWSVLNPSSVFGAVLLGAVGSLLALGLLRLAAVVRERWLKPAKAAATFRLFVTKRARELFMSHIAGDSRRLIVNCALIAQVSQLAVVAFSLGAAIFVVAFLIHQISALIVASALITLGTSILLRCLYFVSEFNRVVLGDASSTFAEMAAREAQELQQAHEKQDRRAHPNSD